MNQTTDKLLLRGLDCDPLRNKVGVIRETMAGVSARRANVVVFADCLWILATGKVIEIIAGIPLLTRIRIAEAECRNSKLARLSREIRLISLLTGNREATTFALPPAT